MLCCVRQLCTVIRIYVQFLKMSVSLGLGLVIMHWFRLSILCVFWFRLDYFLILLFAFVVLDLFFPVLSQEIGWEERLQDDLFCVKWDVKP